MPLWPPHGGPNNPVWYFNLRAHPHVEVRDGTVVQAMTAREVKGEEKALWWERSVAAFPSYATYQRKTKREIPVVLTRVAGGASSDGAEDHRSFPA